VTERRRGTETSKTRALLLDAAEQLMREDGYAAVTTRRVSQKAGVKPPLIHYYFRTMDDLFIAIYRRLSASHQERGEECLASDTPLTALWEFSRDASLVSLTAEFVALAHHRGALREELARSAESSSKLLTSIAERILRMQDRTGPHAGRYACVDITRAREPTGARSVARHHEPA
jgi:AcrR family transcriptional regulator